MHGQGVNFYADYLWSFVGPVPSTKDNRLQRFNIHVHEVDIKVNVKFQKFLGADTVNAPSSKVFFPFSTCFITRLSGKIPFNSASSN